MGSAAVQGQPSGARAQDWAASVEQVGLPVERLGDLHLLTTGVDPRNGRGSHQHA
jgi:hypothetical protein